MIQEITDEDGMREYITIESSSTVEIVVSGDSGATVAAMVTTGHKTKRNRMVGTSAYVILDHNSSPYNLFNLMISEDLRRSILKECTNTRAATEGYVRKSD